MKTWTTPWGPLSLSRFPYDDDPTLQAWSGADTLLLEDFSRRRLPTGTLVLVYNDAFGALTCALLIAGYKVAQISDSALSQRATLWNVEANHLDDQDLFLLDSLSVPEGEVVLYRLPRSADLLEYQLAQISSYLSAQGTFIASGMTKEIHTTTLTLIENLLGPTTTTPADYKARLIHTQPQPQPRPASRFPFRWSIPSLNLEIIQHAGVFCAGRLDGGTRLFLEHFPKASHLNGAVVDLGCGNGMLGLVAAKRSLSAEIFCVDESFLAVWSARESFRINQMGGRGKFLCGDGLEDFDKGSVDLILCNPPFHFQNAQTLSIAQKMFQMSVKVLKPNGELWVVANRHLGHHKLLKELFPRIATVAYDEKYALFRCFKALENSAL